MHPNIEAFAALRARSQGRLQFHLTRVEATTVPAELSGVRISFLRLYLVDELHDLVSSVPGDE